MITDESEHAPVRQSPSWAYTARQVLPPLSMVGGRYSVLCCRDVVCIWELQCLWQFLPMKKETREKEEMREARRQRRGPKLISFSQILRLGYKCVHCRGIPAEILTQSRALLRKQGRKCGNKPVGT